MKTNTPSSVKIVRAQDGRIVKLVERVESVDFAEDGPCDPDDYPFEDQYWPHPEQLNPSLPAVEGRRRAHFELML